MMAYKSKYKLEILEMAKEKGYVTSKMIQKRFGMNRFNAWSRLYEYESKNWLKRFPGRVGSSAGHFCWVFKLTVAGENEIKRVQRKVEAAEPGVWG